MEGRGGSRPWLAHRGWISKGKMRNINPHGGEREEDEKVERGEAATATETQLSLSHRTPSSVALNCKILCSGIYRCRNRTLPYISPNFSFRPRQKKKKTLDVYYRNRENKLLSCLSFKFLRSTYI